MSLKSDNWQLYLDKLGWTVKVLEFVTRDKIDMKQNNNKTCISSFSSTGITQIVLNIVPYCRIYTLTALTFRNKWEENS